ncbi:MAG: hypothetical protein ABL904_05405 [Hyphomicrobiaceae bacterium]
MRSATAGAAIAAAMAVAASAAPASACRIYGVEGFTGGPSVVRMVARNGEPCTIRHYTHLVGSRTARVVPTRIAAPVQRATRGGIRWSGNRLTYRGRPSDQFAYRMIDRAGYNHDVYVTVSTR